MSKKQQLLTVVNVFIFITACSLLYLAYYIDNRAKSDVARLEVVQMNDEEFSVIVSAKNNKEFTAYDIDVKDGQAVINLMVEGKK